MFVLRQVGVVVPDLAIILLAPLVYAALAGGRVGAVVSGALALGYYAYRLSIPGHPFQFAADHRDRVVDAAVIVAVLLGLLLRLRRRVDGLLHRALALRDEADAARARVTEIIESITDGFFALDAEWQFTYVNREGERLVGRRRDELLGRPAWDALVGTAVEGVKEACVRALGEQTAVHIEVPDPARSAWFEADIFPRRDGLSIYVRDVTERRAFEAALQARLSQQELVAQLGQRALARDGPGEEIDVLLADAAEVVVRGLKAPFANLLELDSDGEALLMRAGVGWRSGGVGQARIGTGRTSQAGYTLMGDAPVIVDDYAAEQRLSPSPLLVEHGVASGMSVVIRGGAGGRPFGVLAVHDVKPRRFSPQDAGFLNGVANVLAGAIERARSRQQLREREAQFRELTDSLREVLFLLGPGARELLYVNPAYETVWRRSCASLYSDPQSWLESVHPQDRARVEASAAEVGEHEQEYRIVRDGGAVRWIRARNFPIRDEVGRVYRRVGIAMDITADKRAQEAAIRLGHERAARAAAEAAVAARDEVLAIVSHDLRTPLSTVALAADSLESALAETIGRREIAAVKRAVAYMQRLIGDLLWVARIEAARVDIQPTALEVRAIFADIGDAFRDELAAKSIRFETDVPVTTPAVFADRGRLVQVLSNLVGNAIKFTPTAGSIRLRSGAADDGVEIQVVDSGPGIRPEDLPHVFERFWQGKRNGIAGAGLGLAIVKGLVEAHGGRVWAENVAPQGACVHFTLPGRKPERGEAPVSPVAR